MTAKSFVLIAVAGALICAMLAADKSGEKSHKLTSISPRKMADSLHAVIAADRDAYARLIVQRLHADEHRLPATENWREPRPARPCPNAREAGQNIRSAARSSLTLCAPCGRSTRITARKPRRNKPVSNMSHSIRERITTRRNSWAVAATSPPFMPTAPRRLHAWLPQRAPAQSPARLQARRCHGCDRGALAARVLSRHSPRKPRFPVS